MKKVAFFTMDVEVFSDTSCVKDNETFEETDVIDGLKSYVALLKKYGVPVTFFLTERSIERWENVIGELANDGNELAVHSRAHEPVLGYSREKFRADIGKVRDEILSGFGQTANGYRAPCFGVNEDIISYLKELGFKYDSSALNFKRAIHSGHLDLSGYNQINSIIFEKGGFYEIKPPVAKSLFGQIPVCGGGYMRLVPWFVMKSLFKKFVKKENAYLFYVHPFELFDGRLLLPEGIPAGERMYLTRGRSAYLYKIEQMIKILLKEKYEFHTIGKYINENGVGI